MDNTFIFVLIGGVVIWFLYSILKELRIIRTLLELPTKAKESYDKELDDLDEKIHKAFISELVSPMGKVEDKYKKEFTVLVKKQEKTLENRRKHFYVRPEYLEK